MNTLAIDIGNTAIKYAIFANKGIMLVAGRINDWDKVIEIRDACRQWKPEHTIVASTVNLTLDNEEIVRSFTPGFMQLSSKTPIQIVNHYRTPETLGPDRLAAVIAAYSQTHGNTLVIDIGTAITYDFINEHGEYLGGNISPGMSLRFLSLKEHTSKLPLVDCEGERPRFGTDTETAIRCGVIDGMRHEIQGYISEFLLKYHNLSVFLTGGDQIYFDEEIKKRTFADKYLVLKGLNEILRYNIEYKTVINDEQINIQ